MQARPKIVLIGYGPTAESALRSLLPCTDVIGLLREAAADDPVVALAARHAVPLLAPSARAAELAELIAAMRPDAVVVSSYNRILDVGRLPAGCPVINVHYAPLPRYRGRATVNWAVINGEPAAAITIHLIDAGLDSGNILYQEEIAIAATDTVMTLYERLNALQQRHLGDAVRRVLAGWTGLPQDDRQATYCCARDPEDGEIDWRAPAEAIDRLIRALQPPFPSAFTHFEGRRLLVHRAEPVRDLPVYEGAVPGRVIRLARAQGWVEVLAGQGALRLHEVGFEGAAAQPAADIIRSTRATLGLRTGDLLRRIAALESRIAQLERAAAAAAQAGAGWLRPEEEGEES